MNRCFGNNGSLWILIIALILGSNGSNLLNSRLLNGCGWPFLAALLYCMYKNGTLTTLLGNLGLGGGCDCNG